MNEKLNFLLFPVEMSYKQPTGEVLIGGNRIAWLIRNCFDIARAVDADDIISPIFYAKRKKCFFTLYPSGSTEHPGWVKLVLNSLCECDIELAHFGISTPSEEYTNISHAEQLEQYNHSYFLPFIQ